MKYFTNPPSRGRSKTRPAPFGRLASLFLLLSLALPLHDPVAATRRGAGKRPTGDPIERVWPLPPNTPRVRYLTSLRGSDDFRKKPGRWRRFFLGPEKETSTRLRKPYGVATDSTGRVYVTDTGLGAVVRFDQEARELRLLGHEGRGRLRTPIGIALDAEDRIFVSDVDLDRVFCFSAEGDLLMSLGADQGLRNPAGLAIDRDRGRLYVVDSHLHRVFEYTTQGDFLTTRGRRGRADGQFNFPTNIAVDRQGNLYVVDTGNFRVQIFDPEGEFVLALGGVGDGPGRFHRPKGIALDGDGHIYVADAAFNNFQIFNRSGELLLFVGAPGKEPGSFWLPAGIHIDAANRIHVVDQVNARVQVFQYLAAPQPTSPVNLAGDGAERSRVPVGRGDPETVKAR